MSGFGTRPDPASSALPQITMPETAGERRRRRYLGRRALVLYAVLAVVLAGAGVLVGVVLPPRPACHGGLVAVQDGNGTDCIGITDGSQVFGPAVAPIEAKILAENSQVAASGKPWVGVAYLIPLTLNAASAETLDGVLTQLQGAYTAQWEANHGSYGDVPEIKLYLVNEGPTEAQWQIAVNQILAGTRSGLNVVAVAGLGVSTDATRHGATQMAGASLAMFGTSITADDLNASHYGSLVRVAPPNSEEVNAAVKFVAPPQSAPPRALLVQDTDPADDYVQNWAKDVQRQYQPSLFVGPPETFNKQLSAEADRFGQMAQDVCSEKPGVIFFAGRAKDLELFVGALGQRNCTSVPVTVISGDDALIDKTTIDGASYSVFTSALASGSISLYSTALSYPGAFSGACGTAPASQKTAAIAFSEFQANYHAQLGSQALPLYLGNAMLAHDAVVTAVKTIRASVQQGQVPQPYPYERVTQFLSGLHDMSIPGASGVITITNYGPSSGDPAGKPLAIVRHLPNGTYDCAAVEIPSP